LPERGEDQEERDDSSRASRAFWSGTITFGLVSVPVDLLPANRPGGVSLRMLAPDGTPLSRRYWCPKEERLIDDDEIVRGYEVEEGRFVVVSDEELEGLEPVKSREIDLRRFVDREELDPVFFERAYFLAPSEGAVKPYRLLAEAMESTGKAGIATFVMRGYEYLVAILAENGLLRAETMRFADEIRSPEDAELPERAKVAKKDVQRLSRALDELFAEEIDRDELADPRTPRIEDLVRSKQAAGRDVVAAPSPEGGREDEGDGQVIDLMQELKRRMRGSASASGAQGSDGKRKGAELESRSKKELYAMAQDLDIEGRSGMTKEELLRAIERSA
jgi:DNA end-binding protein Ku